MKVLFSSTHGVIVKLPRGDNLGGSERSDRSDLSDSSAPSDSSDRTPEFDDTQRLANHAATLLAVEGNQQWFFERRCLK